MSTTSRRGPRVVQRPWTISRHCAPLATSAKVTGYARDGNRKDRGPAPPGVGACGRGASLDRNLPALDLDQVRGSLLSRAVRGGAAAAPPPPPPLLPRPTAPSPPPPHPSLP